VWVYNAFAKEEGLGSSSDRRSGRRVDGLDLCGGLGIDLEGV